MGFDLSIRLQRIDRFRHGRVIFAGDAAHQVPPFGARGANTGFQDTDNLAWKLKLVLDGIAPSKLLDSHHEERAFAADDNLLNSTRSTDFITPRSPTSRRLRNAVLQLSKDFTFARPLVNSGGLSTPTPHVASPLNTPDEDALDGDMAPGANCVDAPIKAAGISGWFLNTIGDGFAVLVFGNSDQVRPVSSGRITARILTVGDQIDDALGVLAKRYDGKPGTVYLIRPSICRRALAQFRCKQDQPRAGSRHRPVRRTAMDLIVTPNVADPDAFYEELINAQRDMNEVQAELMIAKLVLLLANHVGDRRVLLRAIRLAAGDTADLGTTSVLSGAKAASDAVKSGPAALVDAPAVSH